MRKIIIFLFIFLLSCISIPKTNYEIPPETCCIYSDGYSFIFCVDHRVVVIKIQDSKFYFVGASGECNCEEIEGDL